VSNLYDIFISHVTEEAALARLAVTGILAELKAASQASAKEQPR
jgi:hypothetical protein